MVRLPFIHCQKAHKRRYDSATACLYDNAGLHPRTYRCPFCGGWHLTRKRGMNPRPFKETPGGVVLHSGLATKKWVA